MHLYVGFEFSCASSRCYAQQTFNCVTPNKWATIFKRELTNANGIPLKFTAARTTTATSTTDDEKNKFNIEGKRHKYFQIELVS